MGETVVSIGLENYVDRSNAASGLRTAPVRRTEADGVVDTGAVMLVLPQNVVESLGLEPLRTAIVTYADERKEERPVAGPVAIEVCDRMMVTECVVGPPLSEPLIGQIVLEALDLIADCANRTLTPRIPDYPSLKLKTACTPVPWTLQSRGGPISPLPPSAPLPRLAARATASVDAAPRTMTIPATQDNARTSPRIASYEVPRSRRSVPSSSRSRLRSRARRAS